MAGRTRTAIFKQCAYSGCGRTFRVEPHRENTQQCCSRPCQRQHSLESGGPGKRKMPHHVSISRPNTYRVVIVRRGVDHVGLFPWGEHGGKQRALAAAVSWRDTMLEKLGGRGQLLEEPLRPNTSTRRVGVSRHIHTCRTHPGQPQYLIFGVAYVAAGGRTRTKSFSAGNLNTLTKAKEARARASAFAFREEYEWCRANRQPFQPEKYRGWRTVTLFPFQPPGGT